MKILFLVKTISEYGGQTMPSKSGLKNSARFVVDAVNSFSGVEAKLEFCRDGNEVDKFLHVFKPDICILEALWVAPDKLRELIAKYPHIRFVLRIHSKVPFLAMEGNAVNWIKEYSKVSVVSFNHGDTCAEFERLKIDNIYLPNIYPAVAHVPCEPLEYRKNFYKIGCFGAIRPFKNQLAQAMAAILFADQRKATVHFYINYSRIEQRGESVLKNIRALFSDTRHKLIEIDWLDHSDFVKLIGTLDACMQVSFTETFNIVTADCINGHVPVVVSDQIEWLHCRKANPNFVQDIANVLDYIIDNKKQLVEDNILDLTAYNHKALLKWFRFINR
jgi:hypothetical protein